MLEALKELGMDTTIEHVRDFAQIAAWGVMSTPALVVDGKVVSSGKVLEERRGKGAHSGAQELRPWTGNPKWLSSVSTTPAEAR